MVSAVLQNVPCVPRSASDSVVSDKKNHEYMLAKSPGTCIQELATDVAKETICFYRNWEVVL